MKLLVYVLVIALASNVVSEGIPEHYRVHEFFKGAKQVCDVSIFGQKANIYCQGRILEAVMAMRLYTDSKTFVDKPLKFPAEQVNSKFELAFPSDDNITKEELQVFIDQNFNEEGTELEPCDLTDWSAEPTQLTAIKDPIFRQFAYTLNNMWKRLCRQIKPEVRENQNFYSLLLVPNNFVVPGGRFREYYYWDTLWIIKGLLASGMHETTRNILSNFCYLIKVYGIIPNGGRIYYYERSQPPMLASMFYDYLEATGDVKFINDNLGILEKEFAFWEEMRNVNVTVDSKTYKMYQYRTASDVPRPESFREDVEVVRNMPWDKKGAVWNNLASAAESGLDFSSRWLQNFTDLSSIETTNVVEVDLNAFMCNNMQLMAYFYSLTGDNEARELYYRKKHSEFKRDFQKVFYIANESGWYDYNLREQANNIDFYASNAVPIWSRCYDSLDRLKVEKVFEKMKSFGAFSYKNGIPTSLHKTGEQWDYPNSWPPLEHMIIEGFRRSESPKLQDLAYELAKNWINTNLDAFNKTGVMWEKLSVEEMKQASGGEYDNQAGFGWTNGAILDLLVKYGGRLDGSELQAITPSPNAVNKTSMVVVEDNSYYHYESFSSIRLPSIIVVFTFLALIFLF